ncbi:hypothetical protein [Chloroflexus sp.]|uniref:hypothetical protein n=1 Tax=Chloroflexus sp. TaxID=1904827 RepID=UPI00261E4EC6|nr:hypothetical protein [uncultured Chloroflexus sp.]
MEQFFRWSEQHLGQTHYVLGYLIVLISHNWPIMLAIGAALIFSIWLYRQPSRANAVWLFSALLFGLGYEYEKHVAGEFHQAIDMLFGLEIASWNRPLHFIVGSVINTGFVLITGLMIIHGLQLSFGLSIIKLFRRYYPARTYHRSSGAIAPHNAHLEGENHERAGNDTNSTQASARR